MDRIKDGTTLTDNSPDEIERKHSIGLGLAYAEWMDTKLNLLDTPGYLDYFGEVVSGVYAADAAVVVLSSTAGVEVGTEKAWEVCDQLPPPAHALRVRHGQGARRFRAGLPGREGPPHAQCGAGRDSHRGRPRLPGDHQPLLRPLPHLPQGDQDRRVRRIADPRRSTRTRFRHYTEQLTEAVASTDDALHRALSGWRGDPPRGVHRRR